MTDLPVYVLDRVFEAPRPLVWRAWSDPALLHRWYGPNVETTIHKFDLKPGGVWLNEMNWGGKSDFSRMDFFDVVPLERLGWNQSSTDRDWNPSANPMMPDWPRLLRTTVDFTDDAPTTKVRLTQTPVDATDAELACFAKFMARMGSGWGSGFAILDEILKEIKAQGSGA